MIWLEVVERERKREGEREIERERVREGSGKMEDDRNTMAVSE